MTLGSRLTFDGTLVKGGSGTLVLSNDVDVTSGRAALTVAAFKAAFKFVRTTPNTGCRLVEKPAGEGRVMLVAEVYPSGLLMIVR